MEDASAAWAARSDPILAIVPEAIAFPGETVSTRPGEPDRFFCSDRAGAGTPPLPIFLTLRVSALPETP